MVRWPDAPALLAASPTKTVPPLEMVSDPAPLLEEAPNDRLSVHSQVDPLPVTVTVAVPPRELILPLVLETLPPFWTVKVPEPSEPRWSVPSVETVAPFWTVNVPEP